MEKPDYRCLAYDTGNELEDLKLYKKDLEKYTTFLEGKKPKLLILYGVVKWFAIITLCVLINLLFILISNYFKTISQTILLFGGWMNCLIYKEISKRIL